jgi:hypothetical protein
MKPRMKVWLATTMTVLLLLSANGILELSTRVKLNQTGLIKQVPGTWQANVGSDTVLYWGIGPFGKSFPINAYPMSNNQRHIYILTM